MKDNYDLLVIGGGPGGALAARTAATAGYSVLLVEKRLSGLPSGVLKVSGKRPSQSSSNRTNAGYLPMLPVPNWSPPTASQ
jgi:choline dehydrogenase-like flavoprotein